MRSLFTAVLTLFVFVGGWQMFVSYADRETDQLVALLDTQVMPALESGEWSEAKTTFSAAEERWQDYMRQAHYFLDNTELNDVNSTFGKTLMYIKAEDLSNSSGELTALCRQLSNLSENEKTTLQNIL